MPIHCPHTGGYHAKGVMIILFARHNRGSCVMQKDIQFALVHPRLTIFRYTPINYSQKVEMGFLVNYYYKVT